MAAKLFSHFQSDTKTNDIVSAELAKEKGKVMLQILEQPCLLRRTIAVIVFSLRPAILAGTSVFFRSVERREQISKFEVMAELELFFSVSLALFYFLLLSVSFHSTVSLLSHTF